MDFSRGSGPKVGTFFFGGRPNFLKPSKLREKQTDGEEREALLLGACQNLIFCVNFFF
jgi:hypothetical protein